MLSDRRKAEIGLIAALLVLTASALALLLTALCASWLPGWRAARIRPIEAMQSE